MQPTFSGRARGFAAAPSARARRITACDSRESSKSICKEIVLQRPKTGKFDYLSEPNHPAHSIAFKFFTNDSPASGSPTGFTARHTTGQLGAGVRDAADRVLHRRLRKRIGEYRVLPS